MAQPNHPPLLTFNGSAIPQSLKALPRWAVWKAEWREKRQKYDKIPCYPSKEAYGLSTAKPERWATYEAAEKALLANPDLYAGLGLVVTGVEDLTGIDLDKCVRDGIIEPWAQKIVDDLGSYTEISPSGNGLRIWVLGTVPEDWNNHTQGIEVYAGHEPRFLTITGGVLSGSPKTISRPKPEVLAQLHKTYAPARPSATIISMNLPELLDDLALPNWQDLDLPYNVRDYLTDGTCRRDRSAELHATGIALYQCGLDDAQVLSTLAANPYAMETALDHRNQDPDRALMYLWVEQCQKAKPKAQSRGLLDSDFEDISDKSAAPNHGDAPKAERKLRFRIEQAGAFSQSAPSTWLIKGVIPQAEIGVVMGESGSGKTFFVLDFLLSIALGTEWRGHKVAQSPVLYVCAEGAGGFRKRLRAYAEYHGLDLDTIPLYVLGDAPNLMEKADVKDLLAAITAMGAPPGVICLDTWAQVTAGANENSGEDMGRALGHCKVLHKKTAAMVLLVAHTGKVAERGMRGWSGVKGALDVEINVERSDNYRSATITKLKDGEGEGDEYPFSLTSVPLGVDEDNDPITSCVVSAAAQVARRDQKKAVVGVWQTAVMRCATTLTDLPGTVSVAQLLDAAVNEMPKDETKKVDRRRDNVLRAIESLVSGKHISTTGGVVCVL